MQSNFFKYTNILFAVFVWVMAALAVWVFYFSPHAMRAPAIDPLEQAPKSISWPKPGTYDVHKNGF